VSEEKFSKCEEGGRKKISVEFQVFGKKWKKSFGGKKKNQSVSWGRFLKLRFSLQ
jgi:hypothetical protein